MIRLTFSCLLLLLICTDQASAQTARWDAGGGLQGTTVNSIVVGPDGTRYVSTDRGVYEYTQKRHYWLQLIGGNTMRGAGILHWSANGELMAISDQLAKWDAAKLEWITIKEQAQATAIATTKRGDIILGNATGPDPISISRDNGKTFQTRSPWPGGLARVSHFLVEQDSIVWGISTNGLFKSVWGEEWQLVSSEIKEGKLYRAADGYLWANGADGLMRSTNEGVTWQQRYTRKVVGLISSPTQIRVATSQGIYNSTDDGATWELSSMKHYSLTAMEQDSSGNGTAGTSISDVAAVFFSSKGLFEWTWVSDIVQIHSLKAMTYVKQQFYAAMHEDGAFQSSIIRSRGFDGLLWEHMADVDGLVHSIVSTPNGTIYAASDAGVYRSSDLGVTWMPINAGLEDLRTGGIFPISNDTLLLTSYVKSVTLQSPPSEMPYGIYRSTNAGDTWELFNDDQITKDVGMGPVLRTDKGRVYAVESDNTGFFTDDNGATWTKFGLPAGVNKMFALAGGDIVMTSATDSWIVSGVEAKPVEKRVIYVDHSGGFWSADESNAYHSVDRGKTWETMSDGLLIPMQLDVMAEDADDLLLGGETGLFDIKRPVSGVKMQPLSARSNALRVYPNPARSSISIEMSNAFSPDATFTLVNALGQEVMTFTCSNKSENGAFTIALPKLTGGAYLLNVRDGVQTQSMPVVITH